MKHISQIGNSNNRCLINAVANSDASLNNEMLLQEYMNYCYNYNRGDLYQELYQEEYRRILDEQYLDAQLFAKFIGDEHLVCLVVRDLSTKKRHKLYQGYSAKKIKIYKKEGYFYSKK